MQFCGFPASQMGKNPGIFLQIEGKIFTAHHVSGEGMERIFPHRAFHNIFYSCKIFFPVDDRQYIDYFPLFGSRERYWAVPGTGSHNGGDPLIREDLFIGPDPDRPYPMLSGAMDAWHSVAIGEAVWRSIKEEKIIKLDFSIED